MKKLLFIAAIAALSFASCKKDRVCTCTTTSGGITTTTIVSYPKSSKHDARARCMSVTATGYTETCELK